MTRSVYADPSSGVQHSIETLYQPCSKDRKEVFLTKDGPLFKLKDGVTSYPDNPLVLVGLQELKDRVKLLLILRYVLEVKLCAFVLCIKCSCSLRSAVGVIGQTSAASSL